MLRVFITLSIDQDPSYLQGFFQKQMNSINQRYNLGKMMQSCHSYVIITLCV